MEILATRRQFFAQTAVAVLATRLRAAPAAGRKLVIDCHAHAGFGQMLASPSNTIADPDELLRNMAKAGIDQSVIFPIRNTDYAEPNRAIAEMCRRHPDKFIGFGRHDGRTEKGRIAALCEVEVRELGLRGFKLKENATDEIMAAAKALGVPVLYHPPDVPNFVEFARRYPTIDMILAHLGGVTYSKRPESHLEAIEAAKALPNVYLDTSTVMETRYLERAVREVPAEKIIFGSDAPDTDARLEIFKVRMMKLPRQKEEMILGGNLERMLAKTRGRA